MKTRLILIGLFFYYFTSAQDNIENFAFIPQGSFSDISIKDNDTIKRKISIEAFWISNEITNKEYREYTDYLKSNPDDGLYWINVVVAKQEYGDKWRDNINDYLEFEKCSELIKDVIDSSVFFE